MNGTMSRMCALLLLVAAAAADDCKRLRDCEAMALPKTTDEYTRAVSKCDGRSFNFEMMRSCKVELVALNDTDTAPLATGTASSVTINYAAALRKSLRFYDAQRSGNLPESFYIKWRGDSALGDSVKRWNGNIKSLAGGYYDAGDHLKLNFNLAHTVSVLAFAYLEFGGGFASAGRSRKMEAHIRMMAGYLQRCRYDGHKLVVNVGSVDADHSYWGRAEDMTMERPAKEIARDNAGSDMYAYAAGSLAAASEVLSSRTRLSERFLKNARKLYSLAKNSAGSLYSDLDNFGEEKNAWVYRSGRAYDKLYYAAYFLYKRTRDEQYRVDARAWLAKGDGAQWWSALTWDSMWPLGHVLCLQLEARGSTPWNACNERLKAGSNEWLNAQTNYGPTYSEGTVEKRPDGAYIILNWGSLGTTANYMLIAQAYAKQIQTLDPSRANSLRCLAKDQIEWMLGKNSKGENGMGSGSGFSYMVGYGSHHPQRPHHRGASCPRSGPCGHEQLWSNAPNPKKIIGALVGGPRQDGVYNDVRSDYQTNEVAINFNAGLTGALAALKMPENHGNAC